MYKELLYYALKMHNSFPEDIVSLTTICKTYNQLYIEEHEIAEHFQQDASRSSSKLLQMEPKNVIALFTKGILLDKEDKILDVRDILVEGNILRNCS